MGKGEVMQYILVLVDKYEIIVFRVFWREINSMKRHASFLYLFELQLLSLGVIYSIIVKSFSETIPKWISDPI